MKDNNRSKQKKPSRKQQKAQPKQKERFTFWVRGPNGKPSISATFATVSFFTTTVVYIISIFEKIGPYAIRPFDAAACGIYLVPIMSLYFGRRWTDSRFGMMNQQYNHPYSQQFPGNQRNMNQYNNQHESDHKEDGQASVEEDDSNHFKGITEEGSDEDNGK